LHLRRAKQGHSLALASRRSESPVGTVSRMRRATGRNARSRAQQIFSQALRRLRLTLCRTATLELGEIVVDCWRTDEEGFRKKRQKYLFIAMRIALFGGSFNPPHIAHELACLLLLETGRCDEVWMVPVFQHPFADSPNKALVAFDHRFAMCERASARIAGVRVSRVEAELGGESRTLHTVKHLIATRSQDSFALVVGADLLSERYLWYGWDELEKLVEIIVLGRVGYGGPEPLLPAVSSTDIRARISRGEDVSRLVSNDVLRYIEKERLYQP